MLRNRTRLVIGVMQFAMLMLYNIGMAISTLLSLNIFLFSLRFHIPNQHIMVMARVILTVPSIQRCVPSTAGTAAKRLVI